MLSTLKIGTAAWLVKAHAKWFKTSYLLMDNYRATRLCPCSIAAVNFFCTWHSAYRKVKIKLLFEIPQTCKSGMLLKDKYPLQPVHHLWKSSQPIIMVTPPAFSERGGEGGWAFRQMLQKEAFGRTFFKWGCHQRWWIFSGRWDFIIRFCLKKRI